MKNYDKLKQVIQKANPEIMELKFGCEILRYKEEPKDRKYKVITDIGFAANKEKVWINSVPFGSMSLPTEILKSELADKTGDWIILGRPLRLADVLIAMKSKLDSWTYSVNLDGAFQKKDVTWIMCEWNLQDNNLDNQSEATKQFLIDILVKTAKG